MATLQDSNASVLPCTGRSRCCCMCADLYRLLAPHPHRVVQRREAGSVLHIHQPRLPCVGPGIAPALPWGAAVVPAWCAEHAQQGGSDSSCASDKPCQCTAHGLLDQLYTSRDTAQHCWMRCRSADIRGTAQRCNAAVAGTTRQRSKQHVSAARVRCSCAAVLASTAHSASAA